MQTETLYSSLVNRAVLITGGATGIGASLVEHFVGQGAKVGFIDLNTAAASILIAKLAPTARHQPAFAAVDLTDVTHLREAISAIRRKIGPIRVLINNAANDQRHTIDETTSESWDQGIAVNLKHQFFAARETMADMRAQGGGSIINLGSISWMLKQGGMPVYTTSKAAVQGLTRSLARDLGPYGIRVNTLVPGWVMTEKQLRMWVTPESELEILRGQCLPGSLLPEHIARTALFLASDDSSMLTAQDIIVDGGWT